MIDLEFRFNFVFINLPKDYKASNKMQKYLNKTVKVAKKEDSFIYFLT